MEEGFEPKHEYISLFYMPTQIEVPEDRVSISVRVKNPSKSLTAKPHYGIVLRGDGPSEIYPETVLKSGDRIAFGFHVESRGLYRVLEQSALESLRVDELYELAKKYEVSGRSTMVKEDLINALAPTLGSLPLRRLKGMIEGMEATPPPPAPQEEAQPAGEEPDTGAFAEWARRVGA